MRNTACSGVTLIELMIGLAVLAILVTMGLPSLGNWMQNSQLRSAAESIQTGLQLARAEAVKRNTFVGFNMAGPDSSWTVNVMNPPQQIQSRPAAEGTPNPQIATTDATIIFNGLGKTSLVAGAVIQVTNPTGGACKPGGDMTCLNVTVSTGGKVKMCDPRFAAPDTRAC
ncbi:MAG: GspH/FimT family pseudopilin [Burkholderiales bacterium]|jgi:type IV fimbrial biogenesis protein FimT